MQVKGFTGQAWLLFSNAKVKTAFMRYWSGRHLRSFPWHKHSSSGQFMRISVENARRMFDYGWNASTFISNGLGDWTYFKEVIHQKQHQVITYFENDFRLFRRYSEMKWTMHNFRLMAVKCLSTSESGGYSLWADFVQDFGIKVKSPSRLSMYACVPCDLISSLGDNHALGWQKFPKRCWSQDFVAQNSHVPFAVVLVMRCIQVVPRPE